MLNGNVNEMENSVNKYSLSSCCNLWSNISLKFCSVSKKLSVKSGNLKGPPTTRKDTIEDTSDTT